MGEVSARLKTGNCYADVSEKEIAMLFLKQEIAILPHVGRKFLPYRTS